jgi:hypothetical protein
MLTFDISLNTSIFYGLDGHALSHQLANPIGQRSWNSSAIYTVRSDLGKAREREKNFLIPVFSSPLRPR